MHGAGIEEDPGLWRTLLPPSNKALDVWVAYLNLFICCELPQPCPGLLHLGDLVAEAAFSKSIGESLTDLAWASLVNVCVAPEPLTLGRTLVL